jgi:hypothetical protein
MACAINNNIKSKQVTVRTLGVILLSSLCNRNRVVL